jgi:hypothetical protein
VRIVSESRRNGSLTLPSAAAPRPRVLTAADPPAQTSGQDRRKRRRHKPRRARGRPIGTKRIGEPPNTAAVCPQRPHEQIVPTTSAFAKRLPTRARQRAVKTPFTASGRPRTRHIAPGSY